MLYFLVKTSVTKYGVKNPDQNILCLVKLLMGADRIARVLLINALVDSMVS